MGHPWAMGTNHGAHNALFVYINIFKGFFHTLILLIVRPPPESRDTTMDTTRHCI